MSNNEIQYPIIWTYKAIGINKEKIINAINEVFENKSKIIDKNHHSKNNKYLTVESEILVSSKIERDEYFSKLAKHKDITFVI